MNSQRTPDATLHASALRAGAGRALIDLPAAFFPSEEFTAVHDALHARVLLLEAGPRLAILSLELTSTPTEQVTALQQVVGEATGTLPQNVLVCVTHTFSAPHFQPPHTLKTGKEQQKDRWLVQAVTAAARGAAAQAAASLQEARFGCASGRCDVNVNRDIPTAAGWWLGSNESGPSDKTVTVLRFESLQGEPIALLFNYAVQPSVMDGSRTSSGGRLVTADMAGAAARFLEAEAGEAATAIFCLGAAGDQAPALKARRQTIDRHGNLGVQDVQEGGFVIAELLGQRLGIATMHIAQSAQPQACAALLSIDHFTVACPGQALTLDIHSLRPTHHFTFVPTEDRAEPVAIVCLGGVALVAVRPELYCTTAETIKARSPFPVTLVMTMVNGAAKYMPEQSAYDRITYAAMNSPFGRGAAELLCEKVVARLRIHSGLE